MIGGNVGYKKKTAIKENTSGLIIEEYNLVKMVVNHINLLP